MNGDGPTFVVTAELDRDNFAWLNELRQRHFPPERNYLDAHLTLFHKLDVAAVEILKQTVRAQARGPMPLRFEGIRKLGRGVAIGVVSPDLTRLHAMCATALKGRLTAQDQQSLRPHVTIQNKADPKIAAALHAALSANFIAREGHTGAVLIWRYLGGPWEPVEKICLAMRGD